MTKAKADYQALSKELDTIMSELQSEDLDVDRALVCYKRGLQLVKQLEAYLEQAENTIHELRSSVEAR